MQIMSSRPNTLRNLSLFSNQNPIVYVLITSDQTFAGEEVVVDEMWITPISELLTVLL